MYRCVPVVKKNSSTIDEVTIQSTWNWNISRLVTYWNHGPSCEMPPFARRLHDNLSQNVWNFYHILVLPYHSATQSLINFRVILDFLEFKNRRPQCFRPKDVAKVVQVHSNSMRGDYRLTREHIYDFSAHLCAFFVALVVQIWINSQQLHKIHLMP